MPAANLIVPYLEPGEFAALAGNIAANVGGAWSTELPLGIHHAVAGAACVESSEQSEWARRLSIASGGFCLSRRDETHVSVVFLAGFEFTSPTLDAWELGFEQLCGLPWREDLVQVNRVARLTPHPPAVTAPPSLTRAMFANAGGQALRHVATRVRAQGLPVEGWRFLERSAPLSGLPFILFEKKGTCDEKLLGYVAQGLGAYAAAAELCHGGEPAGWWFDPSRTEAVHEMGAGEVIAILRDLAVTMGEAAGLFRWPQREPGHALNAIPLTPPGTSAV